MPELTFANLNDENYHDWKIYMEAVLVKKKVWPVVSGLERHPGGTEGTKKVRDFRAKQYLARAEIILHVSPSQLAHCSHDDPMIIWNTLSDTHSPCGRSTIIALRRRLHKLRLERTETMAGYIARGRHLAKLISDAGHSLSDDDLLLAITSGLPRSYEAFLVSLDTLPDSEYTLNTVIPRLINEYTRQTITSPYVSHTHTQPTPATPVDDAMAITSISTGPGRRPLAEITCFKCHKKGHYQSDCPDSQNSGGVNAVEGADDDDDDAF
ncbi:hypothetical protein NP233_g9578 [Leucocoprinus birnbaumii]|uniref:CCHC-type domain-containing protein n=1 Tax=Leucocoprinus birnbaumii TaxID=56174 RepID=A0AAD5YSQ3_9AGAR|nr:hypothetical protein NP233_g9578 [Leucocoprinus birnbaumii]